VETWKQERERERREGEREGKEEGLSYFRYHTYIFAAD